MNTLISYGKSYGKRVKHEECFTFCCYYVIVLILVQNAVGICMTNWTLTIVCFALR